MHFVIDITLTTLDHNGRSASWKVDITDIIDNPDNITNHIIIDAEINIPDTDGGDGMVPDVKDWEDEVTHVPIS